VSFSEPAFGARAPLGSISANVTSHQLQSTFQATNNSKDWDFQRLHGFKNVKSMEKNSVAAAGGTGPQTDVITVVADPHIITMPSFNLKPLSSIGRISFTKPGTTSMPGTFKLSLIHLYFTDSHCYRRI
jgi:hypothetical protein